MKIDGHEKKDDQFNRPQTRDISLSEKNMLNQWAQLSRGFGSSRNFLMMPPVMRKVGYQDHRDRLEEELARDIHSAQTILGDYSRFTKRSPAVSRRLKVYLANLQG